MVYKIRVILDTKDDIFRDIEIKDKQTLWNLHLGVKSAFSLSGEDLSIFHILDEEGMVVKSVPLEDMSDDGDGEIASDVYINEAFEKVGDKLQFQFGFMDLWEFFCELIEIYDEKPAVNYPITIFRFGNVPLKAPGKSGNSAGSAKDIALALDEEFPLDDEFASEKFASNEDFDDDEDDDYEDEFYDDDDKDEI